MITLGGDAELELVDTLDPFSEVRKGMCLCVCVNDKCVWFVMGADVVCMCL